jgi:predicted RND superfamily exporter protein
MASFPLVSATGMLGSGFRAESLDKAISLGARMIGCDAGSTDPGPGPLGTGTCMFSAAAVKRDTEIMMTRAIKAGIPLIIGSAGTSGSDAGLAWMVDIVRGIVREQNLHFKLAVIHSELSRESVSHRNLSVAATISFNLAPNVSLSQATAAIEDKVGQLSMPASVRGGFEGATKVFQQSLANEPYLIAAALLAVYIVLGVLYESYIHPITILSTLPSAGAGAVLALMATDTEFSIVALIGVILLIGIVKKNAIIMIDFALNAERRLGLSPRDAIYEACLKRFRPIMMTTMAAMLGAAPLAISFGEGAELRRPLGISIVGGLIVSQLLTLYTTPVIYLYLDRVRLVARRRWRIRYLHLDQTAKARK